MAAAESDRAAAGVCRPPHRLRTFIARREFGIFLVLVALILYFNARNSAFTGRSNWATLVEYGSPILIAAVGETMLLICGEIDLSVGHVYALAPLVLYKVAEHGWRAGRRPRRRPRRGGPGRARRTASSPST